LANFKDILLKKCNNNVSYYNNCVTNLLALMSNFAELNKL